MNDPILEKNVERLLRRCVPRIPEEQIERSLARALRRGDKPVRSGALPLAVAAAAVLAIAGWLVISSRPGTSEPARQDPPKPEVAREIDRLINELGAAGSAREKAELRLRQIGGPALEALDKALYHANPEVRLPARDVARLIRKDLSAKAALETARAQSAPIREAVRRVRERWKARDFTDLAEAVREAFRPVKLGVVHYVPKKEIGDEFRLARQNENDSLSREIAEALEREGGMVFLSKANDAPVAYGSRVLFTLPDEKGWSAYVVAEIVGVPVIKDWKGKPYASETFKSRLLASAENRMVWGMDPDEIDWADQNFDSMLDSQFQGSRHAGGGIKIEQLTAGGILAQRGLMAGDVVKDINGQPVNSAADVRKAFGSPAMSQSSVLRINVERSEKPMVLEYRALPR